MDIIELGKFDIFGEEYYLNLNKRYSEAVSIC